MINLDFTLLISFIRNMKMLALNFNKEPDSILMLFTFLSNNDFITKSIESYITKKKSLQLDELFIKTKDWMEYYSIKDEATLIRKSGLLNDEDYYYKYIMQKVLTKDNIQDFTNETLPILEDEKIEMQEFIYNVLFYCMLKSDMEDYEEYVIKNALTFSAEEFAEIFIDTATKDDSQQTNNGEIKKKHRKILEKYGSILNEEVEKNNRINPLIGREEEIESLVYILSRKDKPNALLIGKAGVGKSAIAYGLAKRINEKNVHDRLKDKIVYSLDITSIVAGASLLGQYEERIKQVLDTVKIYSEKIILFIDEIHGIVGMGDPQRKNDVSNILKPYLTDGRLQVIGATTQEEYKKHIEKDKALIRRFQNIYVEEPTYEDTLKIIQGIKFKYEEFHNVEFPDELIEALVKLSNKYIKYRNNPDKCIDILDQACTKAKVDEINVVTLNMIKRIISLNTKIPIEQISINEMKNLLVLEDKLRKRVIDQDEALEKVSNLIRIAKSGLLDKNRPIASFLFLGPTGVGKTELAKALSENIFGSEENMLRLDMSEYKHHSDISKLIGSPAGYVGYGDSTSLTDPVKRLPYRLILLDEIEKAHPEVLDLFLQILDEGRLTDALGEAISFENSIIIMTSNIGSNFINKDKILIGFNDLNEESINKDIKNFIDKELKKYLRPEFINRIDEIIIFNRLSDETLKKITKKQIEELRLKVKMENNIDLEINDDVIDLIVSKIDKSYGARPIRRLINKYIKKDLAKQILKNKIENNKLEKIKINMENEQIVFI